MRLITQKGAPANIEDIIEPSLISESAPYEELGVRERRIDDGCREYPQDDFEGKLQLAKYAWTKENMRNHPQMKTDTDNQVREFAYQIERGPAKVKQGWIDRIYFLDIHAPPDRAYPYRRSIAQQLRPFHQLRAARHIICSIFRERKGRSGAPPLQVVFANPAYSEPDCAWIEKVFVDPQTTVNVRATANFQHVRRTFPDRRDHPFNALVVSFDSTTLIRKILADVYGNNVLNGIKPDPATLPDVSVLCPRIWELYGDYMSHYQGVEIIPSWMVKHDTPFGNLVWHQRRRLLYEADIRGYGRKRKRLHDR
jgi:hypothetical protein